LGEALGEGAKRQGGILPKRRVGGRKPKNNECGLGQGTQKEKQREAEEKGREKKVWGCRDQPQKKCGAGETKKVFSLPRGQKEQKKFKSPKKGEKKKWDCTSPSLRFPGARMTRG